ncbi:thioesterase [Streptomyces bambusae]|uniref:thioesterase II family protein n=1 Tax=Streptomyces bambusae TaxID=1550616 RepID=UPI001CFF11F2|nr:alpha/beta fold hydrolase [Streptomyces bambusae]MCB5165727.1 thioesterase [Streptomyces bambusae]
MGDRQTVRLHCFAHAGAGVSSFYRWDKTAGDGVRTTPWLLPGRDDRRRETRLTGRDELLGDLKPLFEQIAEDPDTPYVLYGHSLGATIALTVTQTAREWGLPLPALLAVGASPPPDAPAVFADCAELPEDELLAVLGRYDALPPKVRPGDVWFRSVFPVLRADLRLARNLRAAATAPGAPGPVPVPVLAVAGRQDPLVSAEAAAAWQRWTTGPFALRHVPGDHYFVRGAELPRMLGRAARIVQRGRRHDQTRQGTGR